MEKVMKVEQCELIVCIVEQGESDYIVKMALEKGADGATIFNARGTGIRQKLPPILESFIKSEKEIIIVITKANQTEEVFNAMVSAGEFYSPGKGFIYVQKVEKAIGFLQD
jgi:nitrogen regulatory protein P-II 1